MKALTIRQPWASLIALGVKTIETRGWSTKYRGRLFIHAGARDPTVPEMLLPENRPAWDRLGEIIGGNAPVRGAIVASAELVDCVPMVAGYQWPSCNLVHLGESKAWVQTLVPHGWGDGSHCWDAEDISDQIPYGDFTPGRWAWLLADVQPMNPVRCRGQLGLWEVPAEVERLIGGAR